jgi:phage tail-like protein
MPDYAVYGIHFYGTARYGLPPRFEFSLDYFEALPSGYDRIKVEWGHPSGEWDVMRLMRGNYGFPMDQTEGRLILEASNVDGAGAVMVAGLLADPGTAEDTLVTPLRFHYYTMFLRQTVSGDWVRAGTAVCLLPKNYEYTERLYELTPGVFRDDDIYISTFTGQGMLQSYMGLFGYMLDQLRSELESLLWTADPERVSLGLLPYLAQQLGFPYEAELGGTLARRQLLSAVYLYKMKGTQLGIEGAVRVLTGWNPTITVDVPGHLMVDLAGERVNRVTNPSAEVNTTGWTAGANTTLTRVTTQHAYGVAAFQLAATAGGDVSMMTATGTGGMKVTEGQSYMASIYNTKPSGTVRDVRTDILWYDVAGAQIGSAVLGTAIPQVLGAWTARPSLRATAPAGATTAAMRVTALAAGAGENQFFDGALFEAASVLAPYFDGSTPLEGTSIADYLWESGGTPNAARSHYYHRRAIINSRLVTRLPDFLPAGMTFTPRYAQPL